MNEIPGTDRPTAAPATSADTVPPPAGSYSPPPAGWGAHSAGPTPSPALKGFDFGAVSKLDYGIVAAGLLTFVFTMVSGYYTASVTVKIPGVSSSQAVASVSAWHSPPLGWMAGLIALAASAVLALDLLGTVRLPFPARLATLGGFAVALVFTFLALFVHPGGDAGASGIGGISVHVGHGFAYWLCLVLTIAGTALSYQRFTQTGGRLPSRRS